VAPQSLQGPWPPQTGIFVILLRHLVCLLLTSDQPLAKASTYTGHYKAEAQRKKIHAWSVIRTHDPSNQATKTYVLDRSVTCTGLYTWSLPGGIDNIFDNSC
jgi:hypothetical protein